ncbi:DUF459 domain-containing protein [Aestuariispira ectoiniformans]|uniref:DUF459 domain-containing protein n=1 Tax=Aestuariispira ectoiniformans TaxID=2775080 RepID=UPI00223BD9E2|nr:GDSL-type esterase/lipase family protein [Aestuariispira ectoiniformans]
MTVTHICFVGASTTEGVGDECHLGWPGRLVGMPPAANALKSVYNLGVHGQTTAEIGARWRSECVARLPVNGAGAVVFFFGLNDIAQVNGGPLRRPLHRTLAQVEEIVGEAKSLWTTLWVGPPPVAEDRMPVRSENGHAFSFTNERIESLNKAYGEIASRLQVPYLDLLDDFAGRAEWLASLRANDGLHPAGTGYQMLAEKVADWKVWQDLF